MVERRAVLAVNRSVKRAALTLADVVAEVAGQPALKSAMDSLATERRVTFDSVWPAAIAPIAAGCYRADPRPLLVILAQIADSESVAAELGELLGERVDVFPPGSEETELESLQHQETAQRLHVLSGLYNYSIASRDANEAQPLAPPIIVTTLQALLHSVPSPNSLEGDKRIIAAGRRIDVDDLRNWLVQAGYHATSSVQLPGEFAMRGGIMDIYPPDEPMPVRIELFDNEVESLRTFDITSQRSIEQRSELQLLAVQGSVAQDGSLLDYLTERTVVFVHEQRTITAATDAFLHRVPFPERFPAPETAWKRIGEFPIVYSSQLSEEGYLGQLVRLPLGTVERIGGDLERLASDIDQHSGSRNVIVVAMNAGERDRLRELLAISKATQEDRLETVGRSHAESRPPRHADNRHDDVWQQRKAGRYCRAPLPGA